MAKRSGWWVLAGLAIVLVVAWAPDAWAQLGTSGAPPTSRAGTWGERIKSWMVWGALIASFGGIIWGAVQMFQNLMAGLIKVGIGAFAVAIILSVSELTSGIA